MDADVIAASPIESMLAGLSPAGMAASLAAPDPYVPIPSIRFFTGELRSQRCIDGRSWPLATDAVLGGHGSDPKRTVAVDPAVAAICARSLRPHSRTGAIAECFPICRNRHSGRV